MSDLGSLLGGLFGDGGSSIVTLILALFNPLLALIVALLGG